MARRMVSTKNLEVLNQMEATNATTTTIGTNVIIDGSLSIGGELNVTTDDAHLEGDLTVDGSVSVDGTISATDGIDSGDSQSGAVLASDGDASSYWTRALNIDSISGDVITINAGTGVYGTVDSGLYFSNSEDSESAVVSLLPNGNVALSGNNITLEILDNTIGNIIFANLPTADPQVEGALWNDNGVLKISAGA